MIRPMHAHYLTVSETRRWSLDHPVGNPYHDFKTKEMPVAAVAAIAIGAVGVATAATTIALVAAGLTLASGAFSLAGQITGNATLSKIGMVAGIAGAGVGLFGAATGALEFASGSEISASAGGAEAASAADAVQAAPVAGTQAANEAAAAATTAPSNVNLDVLQGGVTSGNPLGIPAGTNTINGPLTGAPADSLAGNISNVPPAGTDSALKFGELNTGTSNGLLGTLKDVGSYLTDPKNATLMTKGMDMAGQLFKSYSEQDLVDAQQKYLEAKANGDTATAELARAKVDEINYNLELAKRKQANRNTLGTNVLAQTNAVDPNANIYNQTAKPATGGLIYSGA